MNNQPPYAQGYAPTAPGYAGAAEQRVPAFMAGVYGWMMLGLAVTGVIAFLTASSPALLDIVYGNPIAPFAVLIGSLVLVFIISAAVTRLPPAIAAILFLGYATLNGLWLSGLFLAYDQSASDAQVITRAFWISAGMFAIMSLIGFTTRMDLTRFGPILFMALIGIILASVVNIFWNNGMLYWIVSYLGVLVFVGLTAYDTQRIKRLAASGGTTTGLAIRGALMLYLDFLNLFLFVLRILGGGRRS